MNDELKAQGQEPGVSKADDGDARPVQMTVIQATKIAAIIRASLRGDSDLTDALRDAWMFLDAVAVEGRPDMTGTRPSAELWGALDASPWPQRREPNGRAK